MWRSLCLKLIKQRPKTNHIWSSSSAVAPQLYHPMPPKSWPLFHFFLRPWYILFIIIFIKIFKIYKNNKILVLCIIIFWKFKSKIFIFMLMILKLFEIIRDKYYIYSGWMEIGLEVGWQSVTWPYNKNIGQIIHNKNISIMATIVD